MVTVDWPAQRVKRNGDDSLDVWVGDVWIHFPTDGKPTVGSGQAPEAAAGSDPDVEVRTGDQGAVVTGHGRTVLIKPDGSTVIVSDKPRGGPSHRLRMRRARG